MKKRFALLAACALGFAAAACDLRPEDSVIRAELSKEELEASPGYHQMKAAILYDVRVGRELGSRLESSEAMREMPKAITMVKGLPMCIPDETEFEVYRLKEDLADAQYRVEETAYLCRKEGVYYYHYQGGPKRLNVWFGPYRIERKRVKPDDN